MKNVLGLPVTDDKILVADLIPWIECRDAACAEYLVEALRKYIETGEDVQE